VRSPLLIFLFVILIQQSYSQTHSCDTKLNEVWVTAYNLPTSVIDSVVKIENIVEEVAAKHNYKISRNDTLRVSVMINCTGEVGSYKIEYNNFPTDSNSAFNNDLEQSFKSFIVWEPASYLRVDDTPSGMSRQKVNHIGRFEIIHKQGSLFYHQRLDARF
jgi:hypothetical protein